MRIQNIRGWIVFIGLVLALAGCGRSTTPTDAVNPRKPLTPAYTAETPRLSTSTLAAPSPMASHTPESSFARSPSETKILSSPSPVPPTTTPTITHTPEPSPTPTATPLVPNFPHIFIIVLENKEFGTVIGERSQMPNFNLWASEYTLLTEFYAIRHPSLPNYLALIGGDTFGIDYTCNTCYQNAPTLPDLIEQSGRTWKGYFEDMPEACYAGDTNIYVQKHNPFMYFDSIRLDAARCQRSVTPLTQLNADLAADALPDFALIVPNQCNNAHDCSVDVADTWLEAWVPPLMHTAAYGEGSLIVLTWDEGQGEHTCCGLTTGGGRVATVLISPWVKRGFQDDTQYTHYSLLKTISAAWELPYLGHAADDSNVLIINPWER
jgi:hypothetical protein